MTRLFFSNCIFAQRTLVALLAIAMIFSSCKKDDDEEDDDTNNNNNNQTQVTEPNTTPEFNDGDAILVALKSTSFTQTMGMNIPTEIGLAVGAFTEATGSATLVDAGTITCEGKTLTKNDNNSYVFTAGVADPTGIAFSDNVAWEVSGNSGNGISAISTTVSIGWPEMSPIQGDPTTVSTSSDFTLATTDAIQNADSVIFAVIGTGGEKLVTKAGTESSHTFSASDISGITGTGYVQIVAYKFMTSTEGSKNVYFVNEAVVSNMVTFE